MHLVDEIIELLSRENPAVETALTKTKVLLYRIGEPQLAAWVNSEINGYAGNNEVPAYRIIPTRVLATVTDGFTVRWNSIPIPIEHLPTEMKEDLKNTKVGHGVAALEEFASASEDTLSKPLSPEFYRLLAKGLNKGLVIETAHVEIGKSQVIGILAQIRSRLLDFVLQLSSRMPSDLPDVDTKMRSKEIDAAGLFQNAIFGNNATIVLGNHNTTTIKNIVHKGDFASLALALKSNGIGENDIEALQSAIAQDSESIDTHKKEFGPAVKSWMSKMMGKVIDSSWQIELGVAGGLLTEALKAYYF